MEVLFLFIFKGRKTLEKLPICLRGFTQSCSKMMELEVQFLLMWVMALGGLKGVKGLPDRICDKVNSAAFCVFIFRRFFCSSEINIEKRGKDHPKHLFLIVMMLSQQRRGKRNWCMG